MGARKEEVNTMKRRNVYTVRYYRYGIWEKAEMVDVIANSKEDAYYTASSKLHVRNQGCRVKEV